ALSGARTHMAYPARRFDDAMRDREAEAGAAMAPLGREEGLEDAVEDGGGDARPVIGDAQEAVGRAFAQIAEHALLRAARSAPQRLGLVGDGAPRLDAHRARRAVERVARVDGEIGHEL